MPASEAHSLLYKAIVSMSYPNLLLNFYSIVRGLKSETSKQSLGPESSTLKNSLINDHQQF